MEWSVVWLVIGAVALLTLGGIAAAVSALVLTAERRPAEAAQPAPTGR
jgi:hypothetical protein